MEISASSNNPVTFYVLIAAAGQGTRLGGATPKQYQKIGGKAILRHTIEAFINTPGLVGLAVIIHPDHRALYNDAVAGLSLPPPIEGGAERKVSIFKGLVYFSQLDKDDIILLHDAARPFIDAARITAAAAAASKSGAATVAVPVADTQKYDNGNYISRDSLWAVQTPQAFRYGLIRSAHEKADPAAPYTDDTSLLAAVSNIQPVLVPGMRMNFKITNTEDMVMAEKLMSTTYETRTGSGFDVHAFAPGKNVRLCGVDIPHDFRLSGHSDADVGLHALTDALLGAMGEADIGAHFPPSDPQWQGADSALFLQKAVELLKARGGRITALDVTLICEAPKIGPHRESMRARIASICGIAPTRIAVKATTTEQLGFTGRREGIAAQAVATITMPPEPDHD